MKIRTGFVSNSSSSSFVINGAHIKVYGTGFNTQPDGSVQFSIIKVDRTGCVCVMSDMTLKNLHMLIGSDKFENIKKFHGDDMVFVSGSYILERGGCFYGQFFGEDVKLIDDLKMALESTTPLYEEPKKPKVEKKPKERMSKSAERNVYVKNILKNSKSYMK